MVQKRIAKRVKEFIQFLKEQGWSDIETEVPVAQSYVRIDLVAKSPDGFVHGIEIKEHSMNLQNAIKQGLIQVYRDIYYRESILYKAKIDKWVVVLFREQFTNLNLYSSQKHVEISIWQFHPKIGIIIINWGRQPKLSTSELRSKSSSMIEEFDGGTVAKITTRNLSDQEFFQYLENYLKIINVKMDRHMKISEGMATCLRFSYLPKICSMELKSSKLKDSIIIRFECSRCNKEYPIYLEEKKFKKWLESTFSLSGDLITMATNQSLEKAFEIIGKIVKKLKNSNSINLTKDDLEHNEVLNNYILYLVHEKHVDSKPTHFLPPYGWVCGNCKNTSSYYFPL